LFKTCSHIKRWQSRRFSDSAVGEKSVEQNKKEYQSPARAAASVHGKHVHANDFPNIPTLMGLGFLLGWVIYKYIAPTALGFNSKLRRWKIVSATAFRSKDLIGILIKSGLSFFHGRG
jgi:hypothetical protein